MQQQQNMNQSQQQMSQPPNIISSKDLLYTTDMMSWNLMAMKKAHFYESQCEIPRIKQAMQQVCQMHERHYEKILKHLENANNQPSQNNQQMS